MIPKELNSIWSSCLSQSYCQDLVYHSSWQSENFASPLLGGRPQHPTVLRIALAAVLYSYSLSYIAFAARAIPLR